MPWFFWKYRLMNKVNDDGDGGGGGGGGGGTKTDDKKGEPLDQSKLIAELSARVEHLNKMFEDSKTKKDPISDDPDAGDLSKKSRIERERLDEKAKESKQLESALSFQLGSKEWLKTNESLLPKSIAGIFEFAEKDSWDSAVQKDGAIKAGIIDEFFGLKENVDLLTNHQRAELDYFQKLTKNKKQEMSQKIYDSIFEPTLELIKKVKKAKALDAGERETDDVESDYKNRLMKNSQKHFNIGDKQNA